MVLNGVPKGIRTPVAAVKGQCPRPLDDGDVGPQSKQWRALYGRGWALSRRRPAGLKQGLSVADQSLTVDGDTPEHEEHSQQGASHLSRPELGTVAGADHVGQD